MTRAVLSLPDIYAPIRDDLAAVERLFDAAIASDHPFINELCGTLCSYRGKMLRPALLLLTAKAWGQVAKSHRTLAAVIEMVHMATLVHDDVLDEADERRRQPAIRAVAGNTAAVLLGDYLISHAFHLCSTLDGSHACERIGATANTVCEGELLQNHHAGNSRLTESEYLAIVRCKTGALTATACELGASFAGADAGAVQEARSYGLHVGTAFQIVDDVLDLLGGAEETGKTTGRDYALGKMTLPLIHALGRADSAARAALLDRFGVAAADPRRLRALLEATGSIDHALAEAARCITRALTCLETWPPGAARASLTTLAEFILRRQG
jgi:octaprenyl-diphosphate synthase